MPENLTPPPATINPRSPKEEAVSFWHDPLAPELRLPDIYEEFSHMLAEDSPLVRSVEAELQTAELQEVGRVSSAGIKEDFQEHQCITVAVDSEIAAQALELLSRVPSQQSAADIRAPFENYGSNNTVSWSVVSDQIIRDYLSKKNFVRDINVSHDETTGYSLDIEAPRHQSLSVRLDLMVRAAGFDSWHGRGKDGPNGNASKAVSASYGVWPSTSLDTIKHYAALPSELPAVGRVYAYVQPDGQVFCDNGSGDSHRIAAAILRGDEFIQTDALEIIILKRNLLPPKTKDV